jgi:hypothetical protein
VGFDIKVNLKHRSNLSVHVSCACIHYMQLETQNYSFPSGTSTVCRRTSQTGCGVHSEQEGTENKSGYGRRRLKSRATRVVQYKHVSWIAYFHFEKQVVACFMERNSKNYLELWKGEYEVHSKSFRNFTIKLY